MKKCKFCGTIKDLKPINNKEAYICIDCLHKQTRKGNNLNHKCKKESNVQMCNDCVLGNGDTPVECQEYDRLIYDIFPDYSHNR